LLRSLVVRSVRGERSARRGSAAHLSDWLSAASLTSLSRLNLKIPAEEVLPSSFQMLLRGGITGG
jgi:hypothetical protein